MNLSVVSPPATSPVVVEELQFHLRLDSDCERTSLAWYIETAVAVCENKARRTFIDTTFRLSVSAPPGGVKLPRGPFASIVSCKDGEGAEVSYTVDSTGSFAVLTPDRRPDLLVIEFVAGYGAVPAAVPMSARHAIRVAASHYWRYRGDEVMPPLPAAVDHLLDPIRCREVA